MKLHFCTALFSLVITTTGCITSGWDGDFNPVHRSNQHEGAGTSDWDTILPFLFGSESEDQREWGTRPLFVRSHDDKRSRTTCEFIPPLGKYTGDAKRTTLRFWPLYWYTRIQHADIGEDVDWILFPFFWGGHSDNGEDYFAFFPIGGRIRNFLVYDTFDFVLWPVYQEVTRKATEESTAYTILLLFSWTTGGVRDGSFRILPFYMKTIQEGKSEQYTVLWPFFHYQRNFLDTKHPSRLHAFWPLYTYETSDNRYRLGLIGPLLFMGPLIQCARETPDNWEGQPNVAGEAYYLYDVPWPLVRIERNREFERFRIFPFYSHFSEPGFDSKAYLIPFFWNRKEWNDKYSKWDFYFVPFIHIGDKEYMDGSGRDDYFQFWPLFHKRSHADGSRDFAVLSLIPWLIDSYASGMDKVYSPFWNLYRYQRDDQGASRHSALFTLFSLYNDPYENRISFPLLYNHRSDLDGNWEHNFLLNLFCLGGDREGLNELRFLFIPFLSDDP